MKFIESDYFSYKNGELYCEDLAISQIAKEVSTPVYIYSKRFFKDQYLKFENAFQNINHKIFYACKANYNINIIKLFNYLGAGIDVNSAGEFKRAQRAGVSPSNMIFSGVGKTAEEIKLALENNILLLKAESIDEVKLINKIAKELNVKAPLAIRVNPNVDPATHPYISTGLAENKFGIDETLAVEIFIKASKLENIELLGIDMHIGSQIMKVEPYVEAVEKIIEIIEILKSENVIIKHIDLGGGMGVKYFDENPFTAELFAASVIPVLEKCDCEVFFEPGRSLTANGGCLVSEILYSKSNLDKNFLVVDAAMNDLLRPSIYSAYHHIQPVLKSDENDIIADVVGPICESGDFLGKNRTIQNCEVGDLVAVMSSGAYGIVMSSNYNARRRPAEVLVEGKKFNIIRSRETFEQLMQNENLI